MVDLIGNGASGISSGPNLGNHGVVPNNAPDLAGAMRVAQSNDLITPFIDIQKAIMDARIKHESLAQNREQNERQLSMQQQKIDQDQSQFEQSYALDQQKIEQQAKQAEIQNQLSIERMQGEQIDRQMKVTDWTNKQNAIQIIAENPDAATGVWTAPQKYDENTIKNMKAAAFVASPEDFWKNTMQDAKTTRELQLNQQQGAAIMAIIPSLSQATAESIDLARQGKSASEATKPLYNTLKTAVSDGVLTKEAAVSLATIYSQNQAEVMKQYKKQNTAAGQQTYKTYVNGKEVDPATIAPGSGYTSVSSTGKVITKAPGKKSKIEELTAMMKARQSRKGGS